MNHKSNSVLDDLRLLIDNSDGASIYAMGHLTESQRRDIRETRSDAYKAGWNDALIGEKSEARKILDSVQGTISDDVRLLLSSGAVFWFDGKISLNMNDTWSWALSWIPEVPDKEIAEVANLYRRYGQAGLYYWHSCQENNMRSEFKDINRMVDFVRHEEEFR